MARIGINTDTENNESLQEDESSACSGFERDSDLDEPGSYRSTLTRSGPDGGFQAADQPPGNNHSDQQVPIPPVELGGLVPPLSANPLAESLSPELRQNAAHALAEILRSDNLGEAFRNAYLQAENLGQQQALIAALNFELTLRHSRVQLRDDTQNFNTPRRSLTLTNNVGAPLRTESFDNLGAGLPSAPITGEQELASTLNTSLPRFNLRQGTSEQRRAIREQAIADLSALLNRYQDDSSANVTLGHMRVVNANSNLRDAAAPAAMAEQLENLRLSAQQNGGPESNLLSWLVQRAGGQEAFDQLQARLNRGGPDGEEAQATLQQLLAGGANPVRVSEQALVVDEILRRLPANANLEELRGAESRLSELDPANNSAARDLAAAVSTERMVLAIGRPESSAEAMSELRQAALAGNPYARNALAAILASGSEQDRALFRAADPPNGTANRPARPADLSNLSPEQASAARLTAARTLVELSNQQDSMPLSRAETTALAIAMAGASERNGTGNGNAADQALTQCVMEAFRDLFSRGNARHNEVSTENRDQYVRQTEIALRALADTLTSSVPGAERLAPLYIAGAASEFNRYTGARAFVTGRGEDFSSQVLQITEAARNGNGGALRVLAAIAGGAGSQNTHANNEVERGGVGRWVPGERLARQAQTTLLQIAARNREAVIDALMSPAHQLYPETRFRRETLGRVAALQPGNIPDQVRQVLRDGLSSATPETRMSSISGIAALGDSINQADLRAIATNVSPETARFMRENRQALTREQGLQLMGFLREELRTGTAAHRIDAVQAMGASAQFATEADIQALSAFGGTEGRRELTLTMGGPESLSILERLQASGQSATRFQAAAADTLLSISQHAGDGVTRTNAFNSFSSNNWGVSPRDSHIRSRLLDVQRAHPEDLSVNLGVARLIYEGSAPTTAALFSERGLLFSDATTSRLVEQAVTNYGAPTVDLVLDRMAVFNSLPPDVRRALSGSSEPLAPGQSINLGGRVLDLSSINALPPAVREAVTGSAEPMPSGQGFPLSGRSISAGNFNMLPLQVRRQITGNDNLLQPGQSLSPSQLEGRFISPADWNRLSTDMRRALSGSDEEIPHRATWPDLGRSRLNAEMFNALSPDLRRSLSGSETQIEAGQTVSLAGRTIDSATFNRLPPSVREAITGTAAELPPGRVLRDLTSISISSTDFNSLPAEVRRSVSGRISAIDASQVLAQLANNTLGAADSNNRFLLGPPALEQALAERATQATTEQTRAEGDLSSLLSLRQALMGQFQANSQERVGVINRALSLFGNSGLANFEQAQISQLVNLHQVNQRIREAEDEVRRTAAQTELLSIGQQSLQHARLLRENQTERADLLALQMFTRYGGQLGGLAPEVARSLLAGGQQSGWARLHRAGHVQTADLPAITGTSPQARVNAAFDLLRQTSATSADNRMPFGDAELRRRLAISTINENPDARQMFTAFRSLSENMQVLMVQARAAGTRYQDFIRDAQARSQSIQRALDSVSPTQLQNVIALRDSIREALAAQGQQAISDPESRRQLQDQLANLNQALQFFNPSEQNNVAPGRAEEVRNRLAVLTPLVARVGMYGDAGAPGRGRTELIRQFNMTVAYPGEPEAHMFHRYATQWRNEQAALLSEQAFINGPNGYGRVRRLMEMVSPTGPHGERNERFQADTFANWLRDDGPAVAAGLAAATIFAVGAEILTAGTATPLLLAAVGTGGFMLGSASAREYQYQFGLRTTGSNWGEYMRGTMTEDEYGNQRTREYWQDVARPFVTDWAMGTMITYLSAGLGAQIGVGLRSAWNNLSGATRNALATEHSAALTQMATRLSRLESAAHTPAQRELAQSLLQRLLRDSAFMGFQSGGDQLGQDLGRRLGVAIGEGNHALGFVIGTIISAGHTGLTVRPAARQPIRTAGSHGTSEPHLNIEFRGTAAQERQFFRDAELRGSTISRTTHGYRELTAEGLIVEYTRLGRGQGTPPSALHPDGHGLALEARATLPSEVEVGGGNWRRQTPHQQLQAETARFSEQFMSQSGQHGFQDALNTASSTEGLPANLRIVPHEIQLDLGHFQSLLGQARQTALSEFMTRMANHSHAPATLDGSPQLNIPRPSVVVDGVRIDLLTLEHIGSTGSGVSQQQINAATEQVRQFRNTADGRRLVAEQAIIRMEERLHIRQLQGGNEVFTPGYARFLADHIDGRQILESPRTRSQASLEQELMFALHDQGWSTQLLRHHFGNHHSSVREPVFRYLEGREALNGLPQTRRNAVEQTLAAAPPEIRRQLIEQLPSLIARHGTGDALMPIVESMRGSLRDSSLVQYNSAQAQSNRDAFLQGESNTSTRPRQALVDQINALAEPMRSMAVEQAFGRVNANEGRVQGALNLARAYERLFTSSGDGAALVRQLAELHPGVRADLLDPIARAVVSTQGVSTEVALSRMLQSINAIPAGQRAAFAEALMNGPTSGSSRVPTVMEAIMQGRINAEQMSATFQAGTNHVAALTEVLARVPAANQTELNTAIAAVRNLSASAAEHLQTAIRAHNISHQNIGTLISGPPELMQAISQTPASPQTINALLSSTGPGAARLTRIINEIPAAERGQRLATYASGRAANSAAWDFLLTVPASERAVYERGLSYATVNVEQARDLAGISNQSLRRAALTAMENLRAPDLATNAREMQNILQSLRGANLSDGHLDGISALMGDRRLSPSQLRDVLGLEATIRSRMLDVLGTPGVRANGVTELLTNVNHYNRLIAEGIFDSSQVGRILGLEAAHRTHLETVVDAQLRRPPAERMSPHNRERLIAESDYARSQASAETSPVPEAVQQAQARMQTLERYLDAEGQESLRSYRRQLAELYESNRSDFNTQVRQLEWLSQRLAANPDNASLQYCASNFHSTSARLRVEAHMSGESNPAFQQRIGDQAFQVLVHGDDLASNQNFVRTQGGALSPTGGNHNGQFYTTMDVQAASTYAQSQNRQNPSLMGLAIPAELMNSAWANEPCQFHLDGRTVTGPRFLVTRLGNGSTQTIIHPSAYPVLRERGYFFMLR